MTIRHENAIVDAIREQIAALPADAEDWEIIRDAADKSGFSLPAVMAVFEDRFKIMDG